MSYIYDSETPLSIAERTRIADELCQAQWPAVAADIEEGQSPERVLKNLDEIGEFNSSAGEILAGYCE
jgi:hypothetical protein